MKRLAVILVLILFLFGSLTVTVGAQADIRVTDDRASLKFPQAVTFSAEIQSDSAITTVVLEYGVDQLTCGTVVGKAFPEFTSSTDVRVTWSWDMRQSGSLPPGAKLWWHWLVSDAGGGQVESPSQTTIWLDSQHPWQVRTGGNVNLHWYSGGTSFGQELHDYAAQALVRLTNDVGVSPDQPIDLYIYASTQDMQDAVLYEPSWTGGQAYPGNNIVIIGISQAELEWGKSTEAHEMTHVLIGHQTFSCLGFVPTWLNEGLAVYGEGGPDSGMQATFDAALASNSLSSVRSLSGNFPEAYDQANLAYGESYSLADFLITHYGREKMTALLLSLRDGDTTDQALQKVYGFDTDGLEDAWRAAIGAPQRAGSAQRTPVPTPTIIPTIEPISGVPGVSTATTGTSIFATPAVTPGATLPEATPATPAGQLSTSRIVWTLGLGAAAFCFLAVLAVCVAVIVISVRRSRREK